MVLDYVIKHNIAVPAYYALEEKSRDCWNCTGYLWERKRSIENLPYNDQAALRNRLQEIRMAVRAEEKNFAEILSS